MKLLITVLNESQLLDKVLQKLAEQNIKGGTILESKGMGSELLRCEEFAFFGTLRKYVKKEHISNVTMLFALPEEQVELAVQIIESVVGNFDNPNTGIMMVLPIDYIKGMKL